MFMKKRTRYSFFRMPLTLAVLSFAASPCVFGGAEIDYPAFEEVAGMLERIIETKPVETKTIPGLNKNAGYKVKVGGDDEREGNDPMRLVRDGVRFFQIRVLEGMVSDVKKYAESAIPGFDLEIDLPQVDFDWSDPAAANLKDNIGGIFAAVHKQCQAALGKVQRVLARRSQEEQSAQRPSVVPQSVQQAAAVETSVTAEIDLAGYELDDEFSEQAPPGLYPRISSRRERLRPVPAGTAEAHRRMSVRGFLTSEVCANEFGTAVTPGRGLKSPDSLRQVGTLISRFANQHIKIDGKKYPGVWLRGRLTASDVRDGKERRLSRDKHKTDYYTYLVAFDVDARFDGSRGATKAAFTQSMHHQFPTRFKLWKTKKGFQLDDKLLLDDAAELPEMLSALAADLLEDATLGAHKSTVL